MSDVFGLVLVAGACALAYCGWMGFCLWPSSRRKRHAEAQKKPDDSIHLSFQPTADMTTGELVQIMHIAGGKMPNGFNVEPLVYKDLALLLGSAFRHFVVVE
jgi:hypothetical protein